MRLGNPLSCSINDVTMESLQEIADEIEHEQAKLEENEQQQHNTEEQESDEDTMGPLPIRSSPIARPLSLARIQSLVSMTTPRDGILYGSSSLGASPPFLEFDMSLDGFGCLFLPSVFPQVQYRGINS